MRIISAIDGVIFDGSGAVLLQSERVTGVELLGNEGPRFVVLNWTVFGVPSAFWSRLRFAWRVAWLVLRWKHPPPPGGADT